MAEITHADIYKRFCDWNPQFALGITNYKPWGSTSIVVWHKSGFIYKIKYYAQDAFIMQNMSQDDVNRKFELK